MTESSKLAVKIWQGIILLGFVSIASAQSFEPPVEPAPDPGVIILVAGSQCVNDRDYAWSHPVECGANLPADFDECVARLETETIQHYSCGLNVYQLEDLVGKQRAEIAKLKRRKCR